MVVRYDIGRDELVLSIPEDNRITGYTISGGYDESEGKQVKVKRSILPPYFFDDFVMHKYRYYSNPEEVIYSDTYDEETALEEEKSKSTPPSTVSQEEYDLLKQELEETKKKQEEMMELIQKLLGQKG